VADFLFQRRGPKVKFLLRHKTGLIAILFGLATFFALFFHAPNVGYTRDEGFYFNAAESYAGWFKELARSPSQAFSEPVIRRYYENNREHPVLVKNLMALSYLAFAPKTRITKEHSGGGYARAMRLPAHVFSALGVILIFLLAVSLSSSGSKYYVAIFSALAFILAPRHFYHAQLACFDMPITVCWLTVIMAYRKSKDSLGWSIAAGLLWGLAISVKHNAFFIPPILVIHWLIVERQKFSFSRQGIRFPRIPNAFFAMLLLGPLVFFLHWPFIWHHTFERIGWYFNFHLQHVHYSWEYFGRILKEPPFPWLYPFVVTAITLPFPTLLLGTWGFCSVLGKRMGHPFRLLYRALARFGGISLADQKDKDQENNDSFDQWLLLLNSFIPIMVIAMPNVPIFGGMKHWLQAMPFICILAGILLDRIIRGLPWQSGSFRFKLAWGVIAGFVILPSLLGLIRINPYGSSFYNSMIGGVRGAATSGFQRQYWSDSVVGVLPWINENLPQGSSLYLHEVTASSIIGYKRDGKLRNDLRTTWSPKQADYVVYQYYREFADVEYETWNKLGHKKPLHGLYLDEVPVVLVYGN
jgi:hypothetical protein